MNILSKNYSQQDSAQPIKAILFEMFSIQEIVIYLLLLYLTIERIVNRSGKLVHSYR